MSDVKNFLKLLARTDYPSPKTISVADYMDYNLDEFLLDLKAELGDEGVLDFCEKAIHKLTGEVGLKIELFGPNGDEFVYIHIYPIFYDEDESENDVVCNSDWGESRLLWTNENGTQEYITIETLIENTDMGDWGELDDMLGDIRSKAYSIVIKNCGFGVWWHN